MVVRKTKLMQSALSWNKFSASKMEDLSFKVESPSTKTLPNNLKIHYLFMKKMIKMDRKNTLIQMALTSLRSHNLQEKLRTMVKLVMKKDSSRDKKTRSKEKRGRKNFKKELKEKRGWQLKEILRE